MNNIVQYGATTLVHLNLLWYVKDGSSEQWQYIEIPHNREFLFTDFHGC